MRNTQAVKDKFTKYKERVFSIQVLREEKSQLLAKKQVVLWEGQKEADTLASARQLLEMCNIVSRDFIKKEIEQLVTQALQSVFDSTATFTIEFVEKRNQTEAIFSVRKGDAQIEGDISTTFGGGAVDVISIALRLISMQLMRLEGPLFLDEPGKYVSKEYAPRFAQFLKLMSETFGRQIIMITHNEVITPFADEVFHVSQADGVSKVRKVIYED